MTVFLLGPGRDDEGSSAPLEARRELAGRMHRSGSETVVMEDEADQPGETNLAKFRRLVAERGVTTFLLVVPLRSRLHGLSVEIGHLLTQIQERELEANSVHLALQVLLAPVDDEGIMALKEPGNRTRYYEDLLDEGCIIHRWNDWTELNRVAVAVAIEDALRNR